MFSSYSNSTISFVSVNPLKILLFSLIVLSITYVNVLSVFSIGTRIDILDFWVVVSPKFEGFELTPIKISFNCSWERAFPSLSVPLILINVFVKIEILPLFL